MALPGGGLIKVPDKRKEISHRTILPVMQGLIVISRRYHKNLQGAKG